MVSASDDQVYSVLSFEEWKTVREVRDELSERYDFKGRRINLGGLYCSFHRLERDGFVNRKDDYDQDGRLRLYKKDLGKRKEVKVKKRVQEEGGLEGLGLSPA